MVRRVLLTLLLLACLVVGVAACGGSGAAGHAGSTAGSTSAEGRDAHLVYEYRLTDTPRLPYEGREVVWYLPANGEVRDESGLGTGIRELVVVNGGGATQTDWSPGKPTQTIAFTGTPSFVQHMRSAGASWLIDAFLSHRLGGADNIKLTHHHGHVELTSTQGKVTLTATIIQTFKPTAALRRRLFTLHPQNVTERMHQLSSTGKAASAPGRYWLGSTWHGLPAQDAYIDAPLPNKHPDLVTYGVSYGNGRIMVTSGLPQPTSTRIRQAEQQIFGKPRACTLADGTPAHITLFPTTHVPSSGLGARTARQVANIRFWRIVSPKEVTTVFAPLALLPTRQAACHALRSAASSHG